MNAATLINQTSGEVEYYTPRHIVEAARTALGGFISLDPASCSIANKMIKAERYFTKEDDGLTRDWSCATLWMNHPFGRATNKRWIEKLMREWNKGYIGAACCITYACTSEEWFRPLMNFPQCFLVPRTNYTLPSGEVYRGVTKGSVVTYLGKHVGQFSGAFVLLGKVKI